MPQNICITSGRRRIVVPRHIIDQYRDDLLRTPHFNANTVDTHISFLYSGNLIPTREFLQWYESHEDFPPLHIEVMA